MDQLAHTVTGAALGEAIAGRKTGYKAALWGAIIANIPDLDVLINPFVSDVTALVAHRGVTHSLLFAIVMAPLFGWLIRRIHPDDTATTGEWTLVALAGFLSHIVLDLLNVYGTQIFWPFSDYPAAVGSIFIADPLHTLPLAAGVLVGFRYARTDRRRRIANYIGLGLSSAYLLLTLVNSVYMDRVFQHALDEQDISYERTLTTPAPLNNVLWETVAEGEDGFWIGQYSHFDPDRDIDFWYVPKNHDLLDDVWDNPDVERLRWYTRGFFTVREMDGALYVHDLRYGRSDAWLTDDGDYVFAFRMSSDSGGSSEFEQANRGYDLEGHIFRKLWERIRGYPQGSVSP